MEGHALLTLETRRRIYAYVSAYPGTHMRELQRRLGMSSGTLEYHLRVLVREKVLAQRRQGRYMRFYVASQVGRREKDILNLLRQEVPRRACAELLLQENQSHRELLRHFQLAPSTLSFHLKKLVDAGIVDARRQGRETHYRVREPALVSRCLVQYKDSFTDEVVDRFADAWLAMGGTVDEPTGPGARDVEPDEAEAPPSPGGVPDHLLRPGSSAPGARHPLGLEGRDAPGLARSAGRSEEVAPPPPAALPRRTSLRVFGPPRSPALPRQGADAQSESRDLGAKEGPAPDAPLPAALPAYSTPEGARLARPRPDDAAAEAVSEEPQA